MSSGTLLVLERNLPAAVNQTQTRLSRQTERKETCFSKFFDIKKRLRKRKTSFWTVKTMNNCDLSCVTAMCCLRLKHFLFLVVIQTPESCFSRILLFIFSFNIPQCSAATTASTDFTSITHCTVYYGAPVTVPALITAVL